MTNYLHVYGQVAPHDPVVIMGDRRSLASLANAILLAIAEGPGTIETTAILPACVDGKGYELAIIYDDEHRPTLARPYSSDAFREPGEVWPQRVDGAWKLEVLA